MRENEGRDGFVPQMFSRKAKGRFRRFPAGQGIHHDPAGFACDERHIGYIKTPELVNAVRYFKQTDPVIQNGVPPEARIDRRGRRARNKRKRIEIDQDLAFRVRDPAGWSCHETAPGLIVILRVRMDQQLRKTVIGRNRGRRCLAGRAADSGMFCPAADRQDQQGQQDGNCAKGFHDSAPFMIYNKT